MKELSKFILPLGCVALIGACAPYPPINNQKPNQPQTKQKEAVQQTVTDEEQRQLDASRERLKKEEARRREQAQSSYEETLPKPSKPKVTNYPTATKVPGKEGFIFNPYTQNIVDVKGIASGKLVRDPEDSDSTHKFRVP